jgi:hypothetical protein
MVLAKYVWASDAYRVVAAISSICIDATIQEKVWHISTYLRVE